MTDWFRANPLLSLLGAAAVVLLAVIGAEAAFGPSLGSLMESGAGRRAVPAEAQLLPPLASTGPEVTYPETVARPLWVPTRRPAPEAPASANVQRGQYILQGVIVVGDNRVAMLREKSSGKVHRVEAGKDFNGIKIVAIEKESVTLGLGNDEEKLVLNVLKPAPLPFAAPAAGPFASTPPAQAASPATAPAPPPGQPGAPATFGPIQGQSNAVNPAARQVPEVPGEAQTPLTPEEALARRRAARRQQQGN